MASAWNHATVYLCVSGVYQIWAWRRILQVRGILWNAAALVSIAATFSVQAAATLMVLWFMMR
ncbi:MAG: hypothetical protein VXZ82_25275 [Planctomycetota bacterium]|nr:hypothetical protein [Planctomycetota bacterium]